MRFFFKNHKFKIFFFIIFLLTINISYNKTKISYDLVNYNKNTKIYLDRNYLDKSDTKYFEGKKLIKLKRHNKKDIWLFSKKKIEIFRPICSLNNNNHYKDWKKVETKINIKGISCTHKRMYSKNYNFFIIKLKSGGPLAADPIFLAQSNNKQKIYILNKKEK